jgi:(1->4)-alpha-D-glucan 1-alpha-D-glucosylmutase
MGYISEKVFRQEDRHYIRAAVDKALQSNPALLHELRFIERFLLLQPGEYLSEEERKNCLHFVMRFQQFTGPLMAKGFEDTSLYVHNRLVSLNEVGGFPEAFGVSLEKFHDFNTKRNNFWPHSLNTTATHDTKRGEDVRARLNVLSEVPEEWGTAIRKWSTINGKKKTKIGRTRAPDKNDEYFLYQTLVGTFPFDYTDGKDYLARIKNYVVKAVREAKVHTAWLKPDHEYEGSCLSFVEHLLEPSPDNQYMKEFLPFQKKVAYYGMFNSLSQTLLKITSPGVPDFYQGGELWDLNLVDPDNRRPVDFSKRMSLLKDINARMKTESSSLIADLLKSKEDGRIKLFLIARGLAARKQAPELFDRGRYIPLKVQGARRDHLVAMARNHEDLWALAIAPRFLTGLIHEGEDPLGDEVWHDTKACLFANGPATWKNVFTGEIVAGKESLPVGEVFKQFPVALLMGEVPSAQIPNPKH